MLMSITKYSNNNSNNTTTTTTTTERGPHGPHHSPYLGSWTALLAFGPLFLIWKWKTIDDLIWYQWETFYKSHKGKFGYSLFLLWQTWSFDHTNEHSCVEGVTEGGGKRSIKGTQGHLGSDLKCPCNLFQFGLESKNHLLLSPVLHQLNYPRPPSTSTTTTNKGSNDMDPQRCDILRVTH